MAEDIIGTDFDGVICEKIYTEKEKSWGHMNGAERKDYLRRNRADLEAAKPLNVEFFRGKKFIIITSRKPETAALTKRWLKQYNLTPLHICHMTYSKSYENSIRHKSEMINAYKLKIFYEDCKVTYKGLVEKCPNCKVVFVDGKM